MSTLTIGSTTSAPTRRPARPGQGGGRRVGPTLRPGRGVAAPELRRTPAVRASGCEVAVERPLRRLAAASPVRTGVRLTERGIAVVLVTGVMIAVAALTVVGATALRVTSDGYHGGASTSLDAAVPVHD